MLFISSCSSVDPFQDLSVISPLGVVKVSSNSELNWYGEKEEAQGGSSLLGAVANKVLKDSENEKVSTLLSRTDLLLEEAETILLSSLKEVGTVNLTDKEQILKSAAYDSIDDSITLTNPTVISANGYKLFSWSREQDFAEKLYNETGTKGMVYVNFLFEKKMVTGIVKNGTMGAMVTMVVEITDETGKRLLTRTYWSISEKNIPVIASLYDPNDLMALFPATIEEVCQDFASEFIQ